MDGAARSLLDLWDVTEDAVLGMRADDWSRPTPCPGMDVTDLVVHLAGVRYAGPERVREAVGAARELVADRLARRPPTRRVLGAQCLDMCVHAHDLSAAVGEPFDLAEHGPAALEACRLVVDVAPRLLVAALGSGDATVRLVVRGDRGAERGVASSGQEQVLDRTVHIAGGRLAVAEPREGRAAPAPDAVEIDAGALLLMLTGRRDADSLAAEGSASWSGPGADAFVHRARLVG